MHPLPIPFSPECQAKDFANCPFPKAEFLMNDGQKVCVLQGFTWEVCEMVCVRLAFTVPSLPPPPPSSLPPSLLLPSLPSSLLSSSCFSSLQLLSSGQYYQISLQLQVPESPVNEDIGVFMVNITFYTTGGAFLSTSARPVRTWGGDGGWKHEGEKGRGEERGQKIGRREEGRRRGGGREGGTGVLREEM